ncbi:MAG TPA: hypothetical protein VG273_25255 [Bryobacteraceae bacterium]|jgi:hypothetical protein|nr:hypothetical protein [Bryobacteraceae bacterium]
MSDRPSRRNFIAASAAVAGLAIAADAQQPDSASEPQRPKGLGPRAMVDNRFPVTYETSIPKAVSLLTQYFVALSERNLKDIADLLHFPFASFEGTEAVIVQTPADLLAHPPASLNMNTDPARFTANDGYLKPGAYDVLDGIEVLAYDPVLCGLSLRYNRYGSDGKKLHRCEGIYSVTNNDGRWAIQMSSTIFTPAQMTGVVFTDTIEAAKRCRIDHDLAYQVSDRSVDAPTGQLGRTAAVANQGGQPWTLGPAGRAMEQFKVKGVKSRLRVNEVTKESVAKIQPSADPVSDYASYRALFPTSGVGNWGWVYGELPETRVLHASFDKAHMFSGAIRFTVTGEEASYNTDLSVITYKKGHWGRAGTLAYTTPHDRSNDVLKS